jgi:phosphoglycerol transferase MdoB-like AlkP superfamily enzyme
MKAVIGYLGRLLAFWLLLFVFQQIVFLIVHADATAYTPANLFLNLYKGLVMNLATCVYILLLPMLLAIVGLYTNISSFINHFVRWYNRVMIVICCWIAAFDLGIYRMWGTKITSRALAYMNDASEVIPTLFTTDNLGLFLLLLAQIVFLIWLAHKLIVPFPVINIKRIPSIVLSLVLPAIAFIGLRGGTENVPLNRNRVFYSQHSVFNYAALNGFWNLADLLNKPLESNDNPYHYMDPQLAQQLLAEMHHETGDSNLNILTTTRPNLVFIFLESWSADVMECLGGEKNITPKFCEIAKQGMLFTNCYATGFRTEQGMLGLLSAYPAQPVSSIIKQFGKFDKLPNLYRTLHNQGYHTSFYSGGSLQFDNIEGYLRSAGVDKMVGENDWSFTKFTHWGAYDEETFAMHLKELGNLPQPFMSGMTTMITHEAFEGDVPVYFTGDADKTNDAYRNSMHYADSCLFVYLTQAQQQPWYANTLFVVVADHGCRFPNKRNNFETGRHKIPLLLFGGALKPKYRGYVYAQTASQVDVPHTLLSQMKLPADDYTRSKNLFNPYAPKFAYYAFDNGFGLITDSQTVIFDHTRLQEISGNPNKKLLNMGKAYLQTNFQENLDYAEIKPR